MASSKKPPPSRSPSSTPRKPSLDSSESRLLKHLEDFLRPLAGPGQKLLAAFSGGLDSRVLLELLTRLQPVLQYELSAMHVHHGLSANADSWADFCRTVCLDLNIPLEIVHVEVPADSGKGKEAAARKARYAVLNGGGADFIALAHHEGDQAETLLLQLLRGAGVKGLSVMAKHDGKNRYLRPLLDVPRAELADFAAQQELTWIEDESNADTGYDRNFCRHQILPVMEQRFPAATRTLARSAFHLAESAQLLDQLAELDARSCIQDGQLNVKAMAGLTEPRARNLLRWWLAGHQQTMPSAQRLEEMLRQLLSARADASVKIAVDGEQGVWLRRYRDLAYLESGAATLPLGLMWQGEAELTLPDGSRLVFEEKLGEGLAFRRLGINKLRISSRLGGERFRPDANKPTRTLKHLLQESHMPPWQRQRLPLLYCDDTLAVVPGIGVAADMHALAQEPGLVVTWQV